MNMYNFAVWFSIFSVYYVLCTSSTKLFCIIINKLFILKKMYHFYWTLFYVTNMYNFAVWFSIFSVYYVLCTSSTKLFCIIINKLLYYGLLLAFVRTS